MYYKNGQNTVTDNN